jgi:anti-sigma B factor antagonist
MALRGRRSCLVKSCRFDTLNRDLIFLYSVVQSSIQVGVRGSAVWVRVEGKGSFLNSGNFKEFARQMVERGYREFIVDLEHCVMLDSTFMGTMAGVALRLKEIGQGHLRVVHCGQRSHELLSGLGLDQLFAIQTDGSNAPDCEELNNQSKAESPEEKKQEQTKEMLKAHEALCEAAPENIPRFKDVLEFLKQDLKETASK